MDKTIFFIKSVLLGTLIVVFISGCGKNTAQYVNSENVLSRDYNSSGGSETELDIQVEAEIETSTEQVIYVYVCGAIQNPGVYTIPEGSRICDLFDLAGGLKEEAATDFWNQASILVDGDMIYVPTQEEVERREISPLDSTGSNAGMDSHEDNDKVNINTASKDELMTIPGIGATRADAIIRFRQEQGKFSNVEDIMQVEGIKEGVYSKIKDYIKIN